MTAALGSNAVRFRQLRTLAGPAIRVVCWQPVAKLMGAGIAFVAIGSRAGAQLRVSLAGAFVAAGTAFLLDDHAAITLASSPTPLLVRRLHRVAIAALAAGSWWVAAVSVAAIRAGAFPVAGRALELGALVATALSGSAVAATLGDRTAGGIAGAAISVAAYATTYFPRWSWLPLPTRPDTPGAAARWLVVLAGAAAILAFTSRDPA